MKKFFKFAAIALTIAALTVACKPKNPTDDETDTIPAAEEIVEEVDTIAIDTVAEVIAEEPAPAPKKATAKKENTKKEENNSVQLQTINTNKRKPAAEAATEAKQGEGDNVKAKTLAPTKPSAADAFKKN